MSTPHKWVMTIVGGVVAGLLGAWLAGWLHVQAPEPQLPGAAQRPGITVTMTPEILSLKKGPKQVSFAVAGATPGSYIDITIYNPGGAQEGLGSYLVASDGKVTTDWPLPRNPSAGEWPLVVTDRATGRTARRMLTVVAT